MYEQFCCSKSLSTFITFSFKNFSHAGGNVELAITVVLFGPLLCSASWVSNQGCLCVVDFWNCSFIPLACLFIFAQNPLPYFLWFLEWVWCLDKHFSPVVGGSWRSLALSFHTYFRISTLVSTRKKKKKSLLEFLLKLCGIYRSVPENWKLYNVVSSKLWTRLSFHVVSRFCVFSLPVPLPWMPFKSHSSPGSLLLICKLLLIL